MSFHTLKTSLRVTSREFEKIRYDLTKKYPNRYEVEELANGTIITFWNIADIKGLVINLEYYDVSELTKSRLLRFRMNPRRIMGDETYIGITDADSVDEFIKTADEKIENAIGYLPSINDFALCRLDYSHNHFFDSQNEVKKYLKLLKRGIVPKTFELNTFYNELAHKKTASEFSHDISNKSVKIVFYSKLDQMQRQKKSIYTQEDFEQAKGLLRMEISGNYQKLYNMKKKHGATTIGELLDYCESDKLRLARYYYPHMYGRGDFYKKEYALAAIERHNCSDKVKNTMNDIIVETSSTYNLGVAIKNLKDKYKPSRIKKALKVFDEIGISPIVIPAKWNYEYFPNPLKIIKDASFDQRQ